jgi:hypothetical protein
VIQWIHIKDISHHINKLNFVVRDAITTVALPEKYKENFDVSSEAHFVWIFQVVASLPMKVC